MKYWHIFSMKIKLDVEVVTGAQHICKYMFLLYKSKRNGAPGKIRTPDPLIRSQVLYPAELRVRIRR